MQNREFMTNSIFFRKAYSFYNVICNTLSEFQIEYNFDEDMFHNVSQCIKLIQPNNEDSNCGNQTCVCLPHCF